MARALARTPQGKAPSILECSGCPAWGAAFPAWAAEDFLVAAVLADAADEEVAAEVSPAAGVVDEAVVVAFLVEVAVAAFLVAAGVVAFRVEAAEGISAAGAVASSNRQIRVLASPAP